VVDKEGIVEQGTHESLLAQQGRYAQLHAAQFR
jgi:ATP-binding cassette subfamily B protein